MTNGEKATRAAITLGNLAIEGFMMPDGSYRMSQTQAAEAVGLSERNARDFLRSKAIKRLLGEGYTPAIAEVEITSTDQSRGQSRISALPLEVVNAYWHWQSHRGNKNAFALCMALSAETLERRFDSAFGVTRSEADYNQRLTERLLRTEQQLALLSDAYAEPDLLREDNERLRAENTLLRDQLEESGNTPRQPSE